MTPDEQIADLMRDVDRLNAAVRDLSDAVAARDAAIDTRAEYAAGLESRLTAAEAERDRARSLVAGLTAERDALAKRVAAMEPPAGAVIPVVEFVRRIYPLTIRIATGVGADGKPIDGPALKFKYDALLAPVYAVWREVDLRSPLLSGVLMPMALADRVLTPDEAAAGLAAA